VAEVRLMHPQVSKALFDQAVASLRSNDSLLSLNQWRALVAEFPVLRIGITHRRTGTIRAFQFEASDWDEKPLSMTVVHEETGAPLPAPEWPRDVGRGHWHASGYSVNSGPFLCMPGIREYHLHSSHVGDAWDNYRGKPGYSFLEIVLKVSTAFQNANV
jgi:Predicted metal binding domain